MVASMNGIRLCKAGCRTVFVHVAACRGVWNEQQAGICVRCEEGVPVKQLIASMVQTALLTSAFVIMLCRCGLLVQIALLHWAVGECKLVQLFG